MELNTDMTKHDWKTDVISSDEVDRPSWRVRFGRSVVKAALHTYWRFRRGLTLGVRAAVLDQQNRVFLIRHTYVPGWYLPGGGVESGETVEDALARELHEEANIELTGAPHLHGVFYNSRVTRRDHVLIYVVREFSVLAEKKPDHEIAAAGFFALDALPPDTTPATRRRLAEITMSEPRSAHW